MRKLVRIMKMNNPQKDNELLKLAKELGASTVGWGSRGEVKPNATSTASERGNRIELG